MSNFEDPPTDHFESIVEQLGIKTIAGRNALIKFHELAVLLDKKQQDYGPDNINQWGTVGVIVRMSDKFARLATLFKKGKRRRPINESIKDTFKDIANYSVIALLLEEKKWPTHED